MSALLIIDMQNDFLLPDSPLCVVGGRACLPHVQEAVQTARAKGAPIFWIKREHDPSGEQIRASHLYTGIDIEWTRKHLTSGDGKGATLTGSTGAQMFEGLQVLPGEQVVVKRRFSGFSHTHLDLMLRRIAIKTVVLCGVQTPNCIRATATDALALDYEVVVLTDATASKSELVQENNLEDMRCMGIKTIKTAEWTLEK